MFPRKSFLPLESNPVVFTSLARRLGVPAPLRFVDVLALDEPSLLPRRILALVLVFPDKLDFNIGSSGVIDYGATAPVYDTTGYADATDNDDGNANAGRPLFFHQTIHNACGLYAVLHALGNGPARQLIPADSTLGRIYTRCEAMTVDDGNSNTVFRIAALEDSAELEAAHRQSAEEGDSAVPASAETEVKYHYSAFVRVGDRLLELNGDRVGPVDRGAVGSDGPDGLLGDSSLNAVREAVGKVIIRERKSVGFALMAVVDYEEE